jgi:hypothetical protein
MRASRFTGRISPPVTVLPIPDTSKRESRKFERMLIQWLNGEPFVADDSVDFYKGTAEYYPPARHESDACRMKVLGEVLPFLFRFAKSSRSPNFAAILRLDRKKMDEESLQHLMDTHKSDYVVDSRGRVRPVFSGRDALVALATLMLLRMLERGTLSRLAQCKCGCGTWLLKWRHDRKCASTACRVRYKQASEDFKRKRNEKERRERREEKERKERLLQKHGRVAAEKSRPVARRKTKS